MTNFYKIFEIRNYGTENGMVGRYVDNQLSYIGKWRGIQQCSALNSNRIMMACKWSISWHQMLQIGPRVSEPRSFHHPTHCCDLENKQSVNHLHGFYQVRCQLTCKQLLEKMINLRLAGSFSDHWDPVKLMFESCSTSSEMTTYQCHNQHHNKHKTTPVAKKVLATKISWTHPSSARWTTGKNICSLCANAWKMTSWPLAFCLTVRNTKVHILAQDRRGWRKIVVTCSPAERTIMMTLMLSDNK